MLTLFKNEFNLHTTSSAATISKEAKSICLLIQDLVKEKFSSSLKLYIFDSGSCNGCELELQLLFSPLYNLPLYGIEVTYDPSDADALLVTGLMTENMYLSLEMLLKELKSPKEIITIGDCPLFKAAFKNTFALKHNENEQLFKSFHIGGCPPEPLVLLQGIHEYLKNI